MKRHVQKISPHFWFDKEAKEAAEFYCTVFPDSKITNLTVLHDTPLGDCRKQKSAIPNSSL
jgi:predicted 3-demethylubiquinone-9 3-methyltransferase (glyoxalase superfamily)